MKVKAETLLFLSIKKIILGVAVLIIAIGATAIKYNRNAVNQEIRRYLYELSVQAKGKVDTRIISNFTILDTISKDVKEKQLTVEEIDNYVKYLGYAYPFNWIGYSDSKGNIKISKRKNIEDNMEHALENNEFIVYFQPKVELKTNKIAGAEALVRWQNSKKELIPPNEFIPIFEKNGFITKLDIYVFEEVCKTIRKWLNEGINPIPVSVNLSRMHLQNPNFLKKYKEIQEKYEVPADLLEIELTETLVFENFEQLKKVIDDIHQMGFSCSIDDFGSGYSSLNLLKEIPVDILKLDRIFFSKKNDKRGNSVIEFIISLAKKLNMTTISEGVETISQVEFLRKADCDLVQGYVYSKPLAKDDFEITFLKNENIQVKKYKEKNKKIKRKQSK